MPGEFSAILWLLGQGAPVFMPIGHGPDYDLVTDFGDRALRVQVKTSTVYRVGRWEVTVCTRGGNQSWSGTVKRLDPSRYDYLFVLVGDGRRWFVPSNVVEGGSGIRLGGPKYAAYEIERGQPIRAGTPSLDSATPWRGSRAVKGTRL
ncbi:MAG TPA: group I intron-associated PD-(D/E)XK endonuclease [Solirubrobacteraceae bacterium]|nr:group I intron-associated PD-(D/E)XK endonuclease [Solirubrobacteraceae bacterium]